MALYFDDLAPECIEGLQQYMSRLDSPFTDIKIPHLGGAVAEEPEGGAAFGHRHHNYCLVIQARWNDPAESRKHVQSAKDLQSDLRPFSAEGAYTNFLGRDESFRVPSAYGKDSYRPLRALKARFDPENVFHLNPSIPPTERIISEETSQ